VTIYDPSMLGTIVTSVLGAHVEEDGLNLVSSQAEPGRDAAFLVLLAFLVTWVFIRTSARLIRMQVSWWPGNVETSSGLHIHHLVWGICLMIFSGFLAFATNLGSPWWEITSVAFGIGVGLTLDEYALWLHLDDVYWTEEGRSSVDAVVVAVLFASLVVLGVKPLGLDDTSSIVATLVYGGIALVFAIITLAKGRLFLGVIAFFIPFIGMYCACRLAKPTSIWARYRYKEDSPRGARKLERARRRWEPGRRSERFGRRLQDLIAGTPTSEEHHPKAPDVPADPAPAPADPPTPAPPVHHDGD
jgi:hypothetical protein